MCFVILKTLHNQMLILKQETFFVTYKILIFFSATFQIFNYLFLLNLLG